MAIYENLKQFAGRYVKDFDEDRKLDPKYAVRVAVEYDDESQWTDRFAALLDNPNSAKLEALIVGNWGEVASGDSSEPIVEAVAAARDQLLNLKHLFFGDLTMEQSEISWIQQSDLSPLLNAYPKLENLSIRGGQGLSLGTIRHNTLRELVIQAGGLPVNVVHEVSSADLPALEHLELWLGTANYGADTTVDDLAPLLKGDRFPKLRFLGLKNSDISDEIAAVVALAPITSRLHTLDLSMGTLGDAGIKALLDSPAVKTLKRLDIHHHYGSDEMVARLGAIAGLEVVASDPQEPDDFGAGERRFVEVSE